MRKSTVLSAPWFLTKALKLRRASLLSVLCLLAVASAGSASPGAGGISLYSFNEDCHELAARQEGEKAAAAGLIIRTWIHGLNAQASLNADSGGSNGALVSMFTQAEDPAWCAGSIEKFLSENADSLPDTLTAVDVLPLWWISVHPNAEASHKEMLRSRLLILKDKKVRDSPLRRFAS